MFSLKYIYYTLLLLPFCVKAQVFKAGVILSGYYDINPDTLINYTWVHSAISTESYYVDINNDSQSDFEIKAFSQNANGGGGNFIRIIPLNTKSFSLFSRTDSASYTITTTGWIRTDVAKPLSSGDTINSSAYNWRNTALSITDNSWSAGANLNITDWVGTNDLFIGLKYQTFFDTIYGWIRVNCPAKEQCYIKEYSSTHLFAGIKDHTLNTIALFPNPATNTIHIADDQHQFENAEAELSNYSGQRVLKQPYSNSIDVSKLAQGMYILKISTSDNKTYYSKFIKE